VNFCSVVIFSQENPCYNISRQNTDFCCVIPMIVLSDELPAWSARCRNTTSLSCLSRYYRWWNMRKLIVQDNAVILSSIRLQTEIKIVWNEVSDASCCVLQAKQYSRGITHVRRCNITHNNIIASAARKSRSYGGPQVPASRKPTTQQF